jgi:hypothetical protein
VYSSKLNSRKRGNLSSWWMQKLMQESSSSFSTRNGW